MVTGLGDSETCENGREREMNETKAQLISYHYRFENLRKLWAQALDLGLVCGAGEQFVDEIVGNSRRIDRWVHQHAVNAKIDILSSIFEFVEFCSMKGKGG